MSFCCAYHHKRKNRQTSFRTSPLYDSHDIYSGACNYPGPPTDNKTEMMGYTKLPIYDDVIRIPPSASPPPPYSSRRQPINTVAYVQPEENGANLQIIECNITSSMLSLASLSHYIPDILSKAKVGFSLYGYNKNNQQTEGTETDANNNQTDAIIITNNPLSATAHGDNSSISSHQIVIEEDPEQQIISPAAAAGPSLDNGGMSSSSSGSSSSVETTGCSGYDVVDESGACSSRTSVITNADEHPHHMHLHHVHQHHHHHHHTSNLVAPPGDECSYDTDNSDIDDDWAMNGVDPNNNNVVVVDIEKILPNEEGDDGGVLGGGLGAGPVAGGVGNGELEVPLKNQQQQDISASIQDLIEDPQAY